MRPIFALLSFAIAAQTIAAEPAGKADPSAAKKLIEWGWDEPGTRFMRENVEKMERFPFDGVVFHAEGSRGGSLAWDIVPEKYGRVEAGFGLWMDHDWRQKAWNTSDFSKNHFTPGEFEQAVRAALERSDCYVWIYTEQPRWWTGERLPQAYVDALARARQPAPGPR